MANSTEPVATRPVLSVTLKPTVEFPTAVGIPLTTPVFPLRSSPFGKTLLINTAQVNGAVPPVVTRLVV
jgi:hypothetical protein